MIMTKSLPYSYYTSEMIKNNKKILRQDNRQQTILFDMDDMTSDSFEADNGRGEDTRQEPVETTVSSTSMRFISFGSGSSGNCSYVGTETSGILVDAGVDVDKVFATLAQNGVMPSMVKGLCLTHDHGDHIRYAYKISRKYKHIRIYCTPRVLNGILRRHNISRRIKDYQEPIFKEIPFTLAGMKITAFEVSHDGSDNAGFMIEYDDNKFVLATDLGCISDRADFYMKQANYLMIESNYDAGMLDKGTYPEYLKNRIRAANGNLDNKIASSFVADNYSSELKYIFLCHLSHDNNTPEIAKQEMVSALAAKGVTVGEGEGSLSDRTKDVQLVALPRFDPSSWFVLRKKSVI